ncbi:hypothetical protein PoB_000438000 [Plakobranchus ocellatus]|uniref:Uncharacterized protein n=1 Tax=Plakobranchus ocellatus TaxID=259542 RepID=A0AAV3Y5X6_9GAST|nr:hypothetical protein PoB_000438000 [Plakobranchus ocellatus]
MHGSLKVSLHSVYLVLGKIVSSLLKRARLQLHSCECELKGPAGENELSSDDCLIWREDGSNISRKLGVRARSVKVEKVGGGGAEIKRGGTLASPSPILIDETFDDNLFIEEKMGVKKVKEEETQKEKKKR